MTAALLRIVVSLSTVFACYAAYVLVAVPMIEPTAVRRNPGPSFDHKGTDPNQRYRLAHGFHFPAGSWELDGPKVLESARAKLLFKEYKNLGDGQVTLVPCTMIIYPRDDMELEEPQRQAIILQAIEGAVLKFDQDLDLRKGRVGNLVGGKLNGPIVIRGKESRPGAGDQLWIETRDVQLSDRLVWTPHPVSFQVGPNRGSGRDMRLVLAPGDRVSGGTVAPNIGGIQSFELARDVKLHVELGGATLLPDKDAPERPASKADTHPPVDVTCRGPFRFDLTRHIATFEEHVDVVRANAQGPSDQLSCELLSIHFAPKEEPPDAPTRRPGAMPNLEPRRIVARGSPVLVRSPSTGGEARCQRLEYQLVERTLGLSGTQGVMLRQRTGQISARSLEYQLPETGRIGKLRARAPGTIDGVLSEGATEAFHAEWKNQLQIRPHDGQHLVSATGKARIAWGALGQLSADSVWLWARENPDPPRSVGDRSGSQEKISPSRAVAQGHVQIDSPQLTAQTERLEVWVRREAPLAATDRAPERERAIGPARRGDQKPRRRYKCQGKLLRVQLVARGKKTDVAAVTLSGDMQFTELAADSSQPPLQVRGTLLELLDADTLGAKVSVNGTPAQVNVRGLVMTAENIQLDRGLNRLWAEGRGRMSHDGQEGARTTIGRRLDSLVLTWLGSMSFDGQTARCRRDVVCDTRQTIVVRGKSQPMTTHLTSQEMAVTLRQRIDFGGGQSSRKVEVAEFQCDGSFYLENRTLQDSALVAIERMAASDLSINQVSGKITGNGPGWIASVRRGKSGSSLLGTRKNKDGSATNENQPAEKDTEKDARKETALTYLHVEFQRGLQGNLHHREVTFSDMVRATYGPITTWQGAIDADDAGRLPKGAVLLSTDQLTVAEMRTDSARRGSIELEAKGNVSVEGEQFTAWADHMSYAEGKDLLILEGGKRSDAVLARQSQLGGPTSKAAAQRILFWRSTNRVEWDNVRYLDLSQLGDGPAK